MYGEASRNATPSGGGYARPSASRRRRHLVFTTLGATRVARRPRRPRLLMLAMRDMSQPAEHRTLSARPHGVVSGLPTMTPILAQLVDEERQVFDFETTPGELAQRLRHEPCLKPICASALSPSIRLSHQRAPSPPPRRHAAERTHLDDLERLLAACRRTRDCPMSTPSFCAYGRVERVLGVTTPEAPSFCASAMTWSASVVCRTTPDRRLDDAGRGDAADAERESIY